MTVSDGEWASRKNLQITELATVIEFAGEILPQGERPIEKSRLHGAALLAHSIELARGIRRCMNEGLPGAAAALARAQYEAALRGHIILHEIGIDELNLILGGAARWMANRHKGHNRKGPPKIELNRHRWRCVIGKETADTQPYVSDWRAFRSDIARLYANSTQDIAMLHDLTHSGFTQSVQCIGDVRFLQHGRVRRVATIAASGATLRLLRVGSRVWNNDGVGHAAAVVPMHERGRDETVHPLNRRPLPS